MSRSEFRDGESLDRIGRIDGIGMATARRHREGLGRDRTVVSRHEGKPEDRDLQYQP